jgi:hypothetical protein
MGSIAALKPMVSETLPLKALQQPGTLQATWIHNFSSSALPSLCYLHCLCSLLLISLWNPSAILSLLLPAIVMTATAAMAAFTNAMVSLLFLLSSLHITHSVSSINDKNQQ